MNTINHESVAQLHQFVVQQAKDDSHLSLVDRRWQAEVVTEIIKQETLKPNVRKDLLDDYFNSLALIKANN